MENGQGHPAYKHRHTPFRLSEVEQGKITLEDLQAKKAEYEGGNSILTASVTSASSTPIGRAFVEYYKSICEAIAILEQNRITCYVEQQITDMLRDLDF